MNGNVHRLTYFKAISYTINSVFELNIKFKKKSKSLKY